MKFHGTAHKYGRDIDTDVIIPARYLNTSVPEELAKHCMEDLDANFVSGQSLLHPECARLAHEGNLIALYVSQRMLDRPVPLDTERCQVISEYVADYCVRSAHPRA